MHIKFLFRIPDWMRPLGRCRCRWEDRIRMDVEKYGRKMWTGFI